MTNYWVKVNLCCIILVLFHARWGSDASDLENEQNANTVTIRYDEVTVERWNKEVDGIDNTKSMVESLTGLVNEHCQDDPSSCSLSSFSPFSTSDVVVSPTSPLFYNGDVKMSFYVSIDGKDVSGTPENVISKATLSEICENGAANLTEATNGKWTVDFVGEKRISDPVDRTLDAIMIPVSICLLLIIVLITLALHCNQKRAEKKQLPTSSNQGGGMVLTTVKPDKADNGEGKSDDEAGPDQGLLKGQEGGAVNA